jgi:ParB-like chromosome segregation protein Spo0J
MESDLINKTREIVEELSKYSEDEQLSLLNQIRTILHDASPMKNEPVDLVLWVKSDIVGKNDYNPNNVANPEMKLLETSIVEDGYTQPVVSWETNNVYEVVDGFHRSRVGKESKEVIKRTHGYLPIVKVNNERTARGDRMASTIRHNRARGKHSVSGMSEIVQELSRRRWSNEKIGHELGMEPDEVLRLKQVTGLAELYKEREFSEAWEPVL